MVQSISPTELGVPLKLNVRETGLTEEQFFRLCQENDELRFELTAQKELVIMPLESENTTESAGTICHAQLFHDARSPHCFKPLLLSTASLTF